MKHESTPAVPTCPRCGGDLPDAAVRCEQCGYALAVGPAAQPAETPGARKLIAGLGCGMLAVMLALFSIIVLFGLLLGGLIGAAVRPS